ncbi:MAG: hypothetical protein ACYCTB_01085 [bacterium]
MSRLNTGGYKTLPAYAGMTLRGFIVSPVGCHSRESGNPVLLIIEILLIVSMEGLKRVIKLENNLILYYYESII